MSSDTDIFEQIRKVEEEMEREQNIGRMGRDEYFMRIAELVARRGTCPRASVGAIIVDHRYRLLSAGYNGSPAGQPHCHDMGCRIIRAEGKDYCIRTVHAEVNAILALTSGFQSDKLVLYSTHFPCFECIKVIASSGIREVRYLREYKDPKWEMISHEYRDRLVFTQVHL